MLHTYYYCNVNHNMNIINRKINHYIIDYTIFEHPSGYVAVKTLGRHFNRPSMCQNLHYFRAYFAFFKTKHLEGRKKVLNVLLQQKNINKNIIKRLNAPFIRLEIEITFSGAKLRIACG